MLKGEQDKVIVVLCRACVACVVSCVSCRVMCVA
jgi:hypothetical protein